MKNGIKKATALFTTIVLLTLIILVNTGETVKFNSAKDFSKPVDGFAPNGYVASYL